MLDNRVLQFESRDIPSRCVAQALCCSSNLRLAQWPSPSSMCSWFQLGLRPNTNAPEMEWRQLPVLSYSI